MPTVDTKKCILMVNAPVWLETSRLPIKNEDIKKTNVLSIEIIKITMPEVSKNSGSYKNYNGETHPDSNSKT